MIFKLILSRNFIFATLIVLSALTLSIDVYLQATRHTSLCTTSSCQVVGEYVRFGELMLVKAGAIFFWVLWLLVFFAGRYDKKWLWGLITLVIMGALAFDGGLLGFQFVGLQEHCQLCIGVGAALFVLVGLFAWVRRSWLVLLLGLSVWTGGFAANSILKFSTELPALSETSFLSWPESRTGVSERLIPRYHFFFSLHCGHCSTVIANLAVNKTDQADWFFHIMDSRDEDLMRLSQILSANMTAENPFLQILHWESEETVPEIPIPDSLREDVEQAQTYFSRSGFRGVPMLIVDERPGVRVILSGASRIVGYLRQQGVIKHLINFGAPHEEDDPLPAEVLEGS
ncbi:hypothetical protein ACTVJH_02675 [Desulfoplanes sp. PS50]